MKVICDENGKYWVADDHGNNKLGPFRTEEEAWVAMDEMEDEK